MSPRLEGLPIAREWLSDIAELGINVAKFLNAKYAVTN